MKHEPRGYCTQQVSNHAMIQQCSVWLWLITQHWASQSLQNLQIRDYHLWASKLLQLWQWKWFTLISWQCKLLMLTNNINCQRVQCWRVIPWLSVVDFKCLVPFHFSGWPWVENPQKYENCFQNLAANNNLSQWIEIKCQWFFMQQSVHLPKTLSICLIGWVRNTRSFRCETRYVCGWGHCNRDLAL